MSFKPDAPSGTTRGAPTKLPPVSFRWWASSGLGREKCRPCIVVHHGTSKGVAWGGVTMLHCAVLRSIDNINSIITRCGTFLVGLRLVAYTLTRFRNKYAMPPLKIITEGVRNQTVVMFPRRVVALSDMNGELCWVFFRCHAPFF